MALQDQAPKRRKCAPPSIGFYVPPAVRESREAGRRAEAAEVDGRVQHLLHSLGAADKPTAPALQGHLDKRRWMRVRGSLSAIIGQIIPIEDSLPSTLLDDRRHRSPPRMLLYDRFHRDGTDLGAVKDRFAHGDFAREFVPDWT